MRDHRDHRPHRPHRLVGGVVLRLVLALVAAASWSTAAAQASLAVNGLEVEGVTSSLVSGTAYAPASAFASAIGARFDVDPTARLVTFTFGGRIVQLRVVDDPDRATLVSPAVTVDGRAVAGPAAVYVGVEPYVPVKAAGEALGAAVSFLSERNVVAVVVPQATVVGTVERRGDQERLVLRASAPTRVTSFFNAPAHTLQLRFERAQVSAASALEGDAFVRADVLSARGAVDVRVQLAPDSGYTVTEFRDGDGFMVVVAFGPAQAAVQEREPRADARARVVIDPAPGSIRDGDGDLTLTLARSLETLLARSYDVELTRTGASSMSLQDRSAAGVGARLFVSLHAADLARGHLRVHHLGDADGLPALEDAIRFNAETSLRRPETDGVRRQVLLELVVDLGAGRRYAESLASELGQAGGYLVDGPHAAPLAVLTGAAGRGLLIEVSPDDLRDPSFGPILAATLATVIGSGGLVP